MGLTDVVLQFKETGLKDLSRGVLGTIKSINDGIATTQGVITGFTTTIKGLMQQIGLLDKPYKIEVDSSRMTDATGQIAEYQKLLKDLQALAGKPVSPIVEVPPGREKSIGGLNHKLDQLKEKRKFSIDSNEIQHVNREIANTEREIKKLQDVGRLSFIRKVVFGDMGLSGGDVGSFKGGSKGKKGLVGVALKAGKGLLGLPAKAVKGAFGLAKKGNKAIQDYSKKHSSGDELSKKVGDSPAGKVAELVDSVKDSIDKSKEKLFSALAPAAMKLLDKVGPVVDKLLKAMAPLIDKIPSIVDALLPCFDGLLNTVMQLLPGLMSFGQVILALMQPILQFVSSDAFGFLLKCVLDLANKIGQFLVPVLEILEPIFEGIAVVVGWVLEAIGKGLEFFTKMITGIKDWFLDFIGRGKKEKDKAGSELPSFSLKMQDLTGKIKSKVAATDIKKQALVHPKEAPEKPRLKTAAREVGGNINGGGQKTVNINFKSFIDGGVRISSANIKEGLNTLEGDLKNMMYRILAGIPA